MHLLRHRSFTCYRDFLVLFLFLSVGCIASAETRSPGLSYRFNTVIQNTIRVEAHPSVYAPEKPEFVRFSFYSDTGLPLALDTSKTTSLVVTFVSESGTDYFVSYPGNSGLFEERTSVSLIPRALAHGGHDLTALATSSSVAPEYLVPAYFKEEGRYMAFAEVHIAGDPTPFITKTPLLVGVPEPLSSFATFKDAYLGFTLYALGLILMIPLTLIIERNVRARRKPTSKKPRK